MLATGGLEEESQLHELLYTASTLPQPINITGEEVGDTSGAEEVGGTSGAEEPPEDEETGEHNGDEKAEEVKEKKEGGEHEELKQNEESKEEEEARCVADWNAWTRDWKPRLARSYLEREDNIRLRSHLFAFR